MTIYDGDSDSSPVVGKYCANYIPPSHISSNNTILIHFKTDVEDDYYEYYDNDYYDNEYSTLNNGFQLEYKPYSK